MKLIKTASMTLWAAAALTVVGCGAPQDVPLEETAAAGNQLATAESEAPAPSASATLTGREGTTITGTVSFTQIDGGVEIHAQVDGYTDGAGSHGFHVHEVGDCSAADFTSAGGHFNPTGVPHGGPADAEHHAGDLGNIEIDETGSGHLALTSSMLEVAPEGTGGPGNVVGRAVILHEGTDDLVSQPTGAAGGRMACGVVTLDE